MSAIYDWFTPIRPTFEKFVPRDARAILEIGSFEGLSTAWLLDNCPKAIVTAVDHFAGGEDQQGLHLKGLFQRFVDTVGERTDRLVVHKDDSWKVLHRLTTGTFDVAFVDGSHLCWDVLHDTLESYRLVRPGGLLLLDDYTWEPERADRPQVAIDAFLRCFQSKVVVLELGRVAVVRKL